MVETRKSILTPEIQIAIEDVRGKFRSLATPPAIVFPSIRPLVQPKIPRIVVPDGLLDLAHAAEGDPASISRFLRDQRAEIEKLPQYLLVDLIEEILPTPKRVGGRGRPPGRSNSRFYNADDFWPADAAARQKLSELSGVRPERVRNKDVASELGISEERYYFYSKEYKK